MWNIHIRVRMKEICLREDLLVRRATQVSPVPLTDLTDVPESEPKREVLIDLGL
jgi:hypothetical protein